MLRLHLHLRCLGSAQLDVRHTIDYAFVKQSCLSCALVCSKWRVELAKEQQSHPMPHDW